MTTKTAFPPLAYKWDGVLLEGTGLSAHDLDQLQPQLEDARREVLETDLELFRSGGPIPADKQPLDAGFLDMPARLLSQYHEDREGSELGSILATAKRLRDEVDRVVVLGIGGSYMGARALMDACCHPYHNELPRSERGGWPRVYFAGNNVDNDATQGLLELLGHGKPATGVDDSWAIVVISKSGGTLETAVAFRQFTEALRANCGGDQQRLARLVVPVTGAAGKLHDLSQALGCTETFPVPDGVGGRFSILSAVGLLPAAIMGLDVVRLLEGAAAMNEHFRAGPPGANAVLDYVAVCHVMEQRRQATVRVLSAWSNALEAVGLWYDQLLAESLGKHEQGATPLTVVNTRDLHSRAQQHQEGTRDKLITNLIVKQWRRDALPVGSNQWNHDDLNRIADRTLPELMNAAIAGTNQAYRDERRPTADLYLPAVDEASLGQLFQMLMLATAVEGRLIGINPYGQPGVELYKQHMGARLDA